MAHCTNTMCSAAPAPASRRTVAMAATHGVYSNTNTKNDSAVIGVKNAATPDTSPPVSWVSVETTFSLAMKPVMIAVLARQSPKPRGAKIGATAPASRASRLCSGESTRLRPASNAWRNHTIMEARKMTVKAFFTKPLALSHTRNATLRPEGKR